MLIVLWVGKMLESMDLVIDNVFFVFGVVQCYVVVFFDLVEGEGVIVDVEWDLIVFEGMLFESGDFEWFVKSLVFSVEEQFVVFIVFFDKVGILGFVVNFVKLVVCNWCFFVFFDMIKVFCVFFVEWWGEEMVEVVFVMVLFDDYVVVFKEVFFVFMGKFVNIVVKVDFVLIGGLMVKVGFCMIDMLLWIKFNLFKFVMKEVG